MSNCKIVCGFPGIGKTSVKIDSYVGEDNDYIELLRSYFDDEDFPNNFIEEVKECMGYADLIMLSTHEDVIQALLDEGLDFTIVRPEDTEESKDIYVKRYKNMNYHPVFVRDMKRNYFSHIEYLKTIGIEKNIVLKSDQLLTDVLPFILGGVK